MSTSAEAALLDQAAVLLPVAVGNGPMLSSDVGVALYWAARLTSNDVEDAPAHRLADRACEVLAEYLVRSDVAPSGLSTSQTIRAWVNGRRVDLVVVGLRRAAGFEWIRRMASELGAEALAALMVAEIRGGRP